MKRKYILGVFVLAAMFGGLIYHNNIASAQKRASKAPPVKTEARPEAVAASSLLVDDFTGTAGSLLVANGWAAHSGAGTNSSPIVSPGLTFAGYPSSGIGNAASLVTSGEDVNKGFPPQNSGSVYAAAMVNVSASQITGDYFFHLVDGPITGNLFKARLFVKKDPALNTFAFGVQRSSTANAAYTGFVYNPGTTYLVVVKLTFVPGPTNDTVDLFVDPVLSGAEPAPTISAVADVTTDAVDIRGVALRQGTAANAATVQVDGIRVATSWANLSLPAPNRLGDFNGDGRTDFAIVRIVSGQYQWWIQNNGTAGNSVLQLGQDTPNFDLPVPADYDGDGKTDVAVWREGPPTQAAFYILQSSTSTLRTELFGQTGDSPSTVGDYDGDGKADVSVYRDGATPNAQSFFFYRGSLNNPTGAVTYGPWGINGDVQTSGDFDGDGKFDVCVRRDNGGGQALFYLRRSSDNAVEYISWGLTTDSIIPGDYDGDGKHDFAVARLNGNNYNLYILERDGGGTGAAPIVFGLMDDDAAFGDYDGDGKQDVGIFRNGLFWYRQSSNGAVNVFQWGQMGDFSVTNEYITGGN